MTCLVLAVTDRHVTAPITKQRLTRGLFAFLVSVTSEKGPNNVDVAHDIVLYREHHCLHVVICC